MKTKQDSCEEAETSVAEKQKNWTYLCGKGFLRSLHCSANFMVMLVAG